MTADDRRRADGAPPSFTPATPGQRPGADGAAIVVGDGVAPSRGGRGAGADAPRTPPRGTAAGARAARPAAARPSPRPSPAPPAASADHRAGGRPASFAPGSGTSRPGDAGAVTVPARGAERPAGAPARPPRPAGSAAAARPATSASRPPGAGPSIPPRRAVDGPPRGAGPGTAPGAGTAPAARPHRRRRIALAVGALVVVALLAWPVGLVLWANGKVQHTPALSGAAGTDGTTYLLTGSDSRADGGIAADGTEGARTDTILLLHVPASGPSALISLPRDTYVEIPDHGASKLNAAFAWGQAPLLVRTVEQLTGLTVDHYAEIGMAGVGEVVTAVGGVNLCHDADVNDPDSGMVWTAGCHDVDGTQALAFARMRKADPKGDVGRAERQRQLVSAVMGKVSPSSLAFHPDQQVALVDAGTGALTLDEGSNVVDLARLALAFRDATGPEGITGTPPIVDLDYRPGDVGSTVRLDPEQTPVFFAAVRDGTLPPGVVGGVPTP